MKHDEILTRLWWARAQRRKREDSFDESASASELSAVTQRVSHHVPAAQPPPVRFSPGATLHPAHLAAIAVAGSCGVMKVEPTAEVPQEEPLGEDAAPIEKLVGRRLTKAQQYSFGQATITYAMLECQDSDELNEDVVSMNTNAAVVLALLLTMVASPDGATVEPRGGNVWAANDFSEEAIETVIGTMSLLYFLTATLCMSGIFFSVFQMGQLAQIKKKLTKTYIGQLSWSVGLAIVIAEVVMHIWFWANLLQISLTQRPWVLIAACFIYLLLFGWLTTQHLRMKQVKAKEFTNGVAMLELKQERGELPSEIQDLLDKPPTHPCSQIVVSLSGSYGKERKKAEKAPRT